MRHPSPLQSELERTLLGLIEIRGGGDINLVSRLPDEGLNCFLLRLVVLRGQAQGSVLLLLHLGIKPSQAFEHQDAERKRRDAELNLPTSEAKTNNGDKP